VPAVVAAVAGLAPAVEAAVDSGLPEQAAIANTLAVASNMRSIFDMILPLGNPCAQRRRQVQRGI
jgi:hypothetical protein